MENNQKLPSYSYLVFWSPKDQEFVATFLELPGLSGIAPTVQGAIREINEALETWLAAATKENFQVPEASLLRSMVIIDRSFQGEEPLFQELSFVLPGPEGDENLPEVESAYSGSSAPRTKTIRIFKEKQIVQI